MRIGDKLRIAVQQFNQNLLDLCDATENDQLPDEFEHVLKVAQALAEAIIKGLADQGPAIQELTFRNFLYGLQRVCLQTAHGLDEMTFDVHPAIGKPKEAPGGKTVQG